ncbi:MAG: hypothetical protein EA402_05880 [Planctomycetota bacterium]|nr:MAG: hypothetical protein EA402_05880 [Planctomycetota bacterium]
MSKQSSPSDSPKPLVSFGQQLLIAVLVVAVGLLFGMGPVLEALRQPTPAQHVAGISDNDVFRHQRTAERLQTLLNPNFDRSGEVFAPSRDRNHYLMELLYAKLAEQDGLAPRLSQIRDHFQAWQQRRVPGEESVTYGSALQEALGTRNAVDAVAVKEFLRVRLAAEAYEERHVTVPSAPQAISDGVVRAGQTRVRVASVTLDSAHLVNDELLAEIAADEAAVLSAYDDLRTRLYRTPARRSVVLYVADAQAISDAIVVEEDVLRTRYDEVVATRFTRTTRDEDGSERQIVQDFADVRSQLHEEAAREIAADLAARLAGRFRNALMDAGLVGQGEANMENLRPLAAVSIGPEDHPALRESVALRIIEDVVIDQPPQGQTRTALGDFGMLDLGDLNLFTDDIAVGYLAAPYRPLREDGTRSSTQVLTLVTGLHPAGYRPLDEVRDDVVRWLAARQVYEDLLTAAREIAQGARAESLESVFADEDVQARRNIVSPTTSTFQALEALHLPAERLGGTRPDPRFAISLAAASDAVKVVQASPIENPEGAWAERPRLRVIQWLETSDEEMSEWQAFSAAMQANFQVQGGIQRQLRQAFEASLMSRVDR